MFACGIIDMILLHRYSVYMSLSDAFEADVLKLIFQNIGIANIGDATGIPPAGTVGNLYVALHTANPGETGNQSTSEIAYTSYARVAVVRSASGWTLSGTAPTQVANAVAVTFPTCTGSSGTATYFSVGVASAGATEICWYGALGSSVAISSSITPAFAIGGLACNLD